MQDRVARMEEQRKSTVFKALPRAIAKKPPARATQAEAAIKGIVKSAMVSGNTTLHLIVVVTPKSIVNCITDTTDAMKTDKL